MLRASDTGRAEGGGTASIFYSEIPAPRIGAHPSNHTTTFLWLCFKGLNNMTYNIRCCVAFISFLWLPRYLCFYRTYSGGLRLHSFLWVFGIGGIHVPGRCIVHGATKAYVVWCPGWHRGSSQECWCNWRTKGIKH